MISVVVKYQLVIVDVKTPALNSKERCEPLNECENMHGSAVWYTEMTSTTHTRLT